MQIKFDVRGIEKIQAFLKSVPRGTLRVALRAVGEWLIGTGQRGLRHYGAYKYVPRKKAYGKTFFSDRQRRYVMARIREGTIDPGAPHRTGRTQRGWYVRETNGGYGLKIGNPERGAYYSHHDERQARLNALVGWRKTAAIIASNVSGAIRHARAAVGKWIRENGK